MAHIVAVTDISEVQAAQIAEALLEGQEIGESLAWMFQIAECIDHWHSRVFRHLGDGVMRVSAKDNESHPPFEIARHVGEGLAFTERGLRLIDEDALPPRVLIAASKVSAGAQRGFFKEHDHLLASERIAEIRG